MTRRIEIMGDIIDDRDEWLYRDWFEEPYASPNSIKTQLPITAEPIDVYINSGGGSVYAGFEIYNLLSEYEGQKTIKIVGICASAASFISQAKNAKVLMSPMSQMMVHRVSTEAKGNKNIMRSTGQVLELTDKTIANAYALKSGQAIDVILDLMEKETFLTPEQALELKLIDEIMFNNDTAKDAPTLYNSLNDNPTLINKLNKLKDMALNNKKNEVNNMTLDELKNKYPDLINQLVANTIEKEKVTIENKAIEKERQRIKEINDLANGTNQVLINEGIKKGLTAGQVAINIIQNEKKNNQIQLENMKNDAKTSGIDGVESIQNPQNDKQATIDMLIRLNNELDKEMD